MVDPTKLPKNVELKDVIELTILSNPKFLAIVNTEEGCRSLFQYFKDAAVQQRYSTDHSDFDVFLRARKMKVACGVKLARLIVSKVGNGYYGSMLVLAAAREDLPMYLDHPSCKAMAGFILENNL